VDEGEKVEVVDDVEEGERVDEGEEGERVDEGEIYSHTPILWCQYILCRSLWKRNSLLPQEGVCEIREFHK
jgi:hypothetical protein